MEPWRARVSLKIGVMGIHRPGKDEKIGIPALLQEGLKGLIDILRSRNRYVFAVDLKMDPVIVLAASNSESLSCLQKSLVLVQFYEVIEPRPNPKSGETFPREETATVLNPACLNGSGNIWTPGRG